MNGCLRWFQPSMKARILIIRSRTEAKVPRWMACFSMLENQTSTRFSQEPEVGVKWTWIRGLAFCHALTLTCLVSDGGCELSESGLSRRAEQRSATDAARHWSTYPSSPASRTFRSGIHQTTLYVSIFRFDESALVNNHTFGSFATHSPVMHLP